jgi:hypothetical protein
MGIELECKISLCLAISGSEIPASAVARGMFYFDAGPISPVSLSSNMLFFHYFSQNRILTILQGAEGSPVFLDSVISFFLLIGSY